MVGVCLWSGAAGWSFFQDVSISSFQVRYPTPNLVAAEFIKKNKQTKKDHVVDESTKHQIKVEKLKDRYL